MDAQTHLVGGWGSSVSLLRSAALSTSLLLPPSLALELWLPPAPGMQSKNADKKQSVCKRLHQQLASQKLFGVYSLCISIPNHSWLTFHSSFSINGNIVCHNFNQNSVPEPNISNAWYLIICRLDISSFFPLTLASDCSKAAQNYLNYIQHPSVGCSLRSMSELYLPHCVLLGFLLQHRLKICKHSGDKCNSISTYIHKLQIQTDAYFYSTLWAHSP